MCEFENRCLNNDKCYRCTNLVLLKLPEDKFKKKRQIETSNNKKTDKDSWKDLEESMVQKLKQVPTMQEVRRTRGSGNQWFETGDVIDSILKLECKERAGNNLKGGDKSISIKRDWLIKSKEEARVDNKTMALPFRFKDDDSTYIIMQDFDIIELVNLLKTYKNDNKIKDMEISLLKEKLNNKLNYKE